MRKEIISIMRNNDLWIIIAFNITRVFCDGVCDENDSLISDTNNFCKKYLGELVKKYGGKKVYRTARRAFKHAYGLYKIKALKNYQGTL